MIRLPNQSYLRRPFLRKPSLSTPVFRRFSSALPPERFLENRIQRNYQSKAMARGKFIVVEGLDRAGKTTQVERLAKWLDAKVWKFPDRTTAIGKMIDAYLRSEKELDDRAIHLLFSANRWEAMSAIQSTLSEGKHIVCDRYAFSGIAYSTAKGGLSYTWCRAPDVGLLDPDLVLFLDLSPEVARQRGGYGDERYEKEEMQRKVREAFKKIESDMQSDPKSHDAKWHTIDAGRTVEEVEKDIWDVVNQSALSSQNEQEAFSNTLFTHPPPPGIDDI